jgi:uncharacterized protein
MLRLELARLDREGNVQVDARVPADDAVLQGLEVSFGGALEVRLRASFAGSGEIVVRGTLNGTLVQECRRCLEPVSTPFSQDVTMVFVPSANPGAEDDGDVRFFKETAAELDLGGPLREELILSLDPYVLCDPDCRGLCPRCGANRNTETCTCAGSESEPRWDALRAKRDE